MRWDCGRRRKLRGRCCLECGCRDRQLQADEGGFRSFGEFAEISRLLWLQGEARSAGAGARRSAVCRNLQWWRRVEASLANPKPKSRLHKIGPLLLVATDVATCNRGISTLRTEIWFSYLKT